jgi:hypothetical protein
MTTERINSDHHPEVVEDGKGSRRLELLGLKDTLAHPDTRRQFFAGFTDDQYKKMLGYINSVTRKQPISYDYGDSSPSLLATPPPEDKASLMDQAFKSVRAILGNDELSNQESMRRAALTMAGAINYIHPYDDGNGRTGRVVHYLIEFGSERGDQAFNDELYAIIAKAPVYDFDQRAALHDAPPPELERALDKTGEHNNPTTWHTMSKPERATERVRLFLEMMEGKLSVPIDEARTRVYWRSTPTGSVQYEQAIPPGSLTGNQLYEQDYANLSFAAARSPDDVPRNAHRVLRAPQGPTSPLSLDAIIEL